MKKLVGLTALVVVILLLATTYAYAESWSDSVDKFLKTQQLKSGQYYNINQGEWITIYGTTIKPDVLIKRLDLDLITDGDKAVMLGIDYGFTTKDTFVIGIGFTAGFDRIENANDVGEFAYGPMVLGRLKF